MTITIMSNSFNSAYLVTTPVDITFVLSHISKSTNNLESKSHLGNPDGHVNRTRKIILINSLQTKEVSKKEHQASDSCFTPWSIVRKK